MSTPRRSDVRSLLFSSLLSSTALAWGVYLLVQRSTLQGLLRIDTLALVGDESWLLPGAVIATNAALLLPGVVVSAALSRWLGTVTARRVYITITTLIVYWLSIDQDVLSSVGRHVSDVLQIALMPEGHQAGGDLLGWTITNLLWLSVALVWSAACAEAARRGSGWVMARVSPALGSIVAATLAVLYVAQATLPHVMHSAWRHHSVEERLYGALVIDLRLKDGAQAQRYDDPVLSALVPEMVDSYRSAFPLMMAPKDADETPLPLEANPPHVVLVVAESLRHDVFGPELMPRLSRWANSGTVLENHDAGTMYSEAGMFALLYGRSPAVYHPTLDAAVAPQLCVTLRRSGYQCGYYTGHPKIWKRREEFLNARRLDHFEHDDRGTWPEWDERALDTMVRAHQSATTPQFSIVFLMSSHFEYRYPKRYEVDLPVAQSTWHVTHTESLGDADEVPHRNRYRNCMRFVDDVVANAIDRLDPSTNIVVFTGDHGESLNDDGRYTHGYSFAEITTRTPMAVVGPGVPKQRVQHATLHVDLLPTLVELLATEAVPIAHTHGRSWYDAEPRASMLVSYSTINRDVIQTQLRVGDTRLRIDLNAKKPQLTVLGFEDTLAHLVSNPPLQSNSTERLSRAFRQELDALRE